MDYLRHRKCREAPLPMHLLDEVKTCLKFGLKPLKGFELLHCQSFYHRSCSHDHLLQAGCCTALLSCLSTGWGGSSISFSFSVCRCDAFEHEARRKCLF